MRGECSPDVPGDLLSSLRADCPLGVGLTGGRSDSIEHGLPDCLAGPDPGDLERGGRDRGSVAAHEPIDQLEGIRGELHRRRRDRDRSCASRERVGAAPALVRETPTGVEGSDSVRIATLKDSATMSGETRSANRRGSMTNLHNTVARFGLPRQRRGQISQERPGYVPHLGALVTARKVAPPEQNHESRPVTLTRWPAHATTISWLPGECVGAARRSGRPTSRPRFRAYPSLRSERNPTPHHPLRNSL
jgi:hypothetical protein